MKIYSKKIQLFTIIISCLCSIIILITPYRKDTFNDMARYIRIYWLIKSVLPLMLLSLVFIIVSSIVMGYKKNITYEILIIVSSAIGFPSIILADYSQVVFMSCGLQKTVYLPTIYFALVYFLFMLIWGCVLLTRKKDLIKKLVETI
ncbi:MAG: hypothetical protein FK733_09300 [Asgard group archaeon]|nr:hypothetical protein [Asgard group archaeon]